MDLKYLVLICCVVINEGIWVGKKRNVMKWGEICSNL